MNDLIPKPQFSPMFSDLKIRKPEPHEHPLTLDVKIGDASKDTVAAALKLWEEAVADCGMFYLSGMTEEQIEKVKAFWDSFDPNCLYEGAVPLEGGDTITVKFSYATDFDQLEDSKKFEKKDQDALHAPDDV